MFGGKGPFDINTAVDLLTLTHPPKKIASSEMGESDGESVGAKADCGYLQRYAERVKYVQLRCKLKATHGVEFHVDIQPGLQGRKQLQA